VKRQRQPAARQRPGSIRVHARWSKPGAQVLTTQAACDLLRGAATADRESFYAIPLDARGRSLGVEEVARGHLTGVEVHPREVFKSAILANAAYVVIGHNHPSGNPAPSPQDMALTRRLADAGKLLGIPLHDHVIVAAEGCTGMRENYGAEAMGFGGVREGGPRRRRASSGGRVAAGIGAVLLLGAAALALAA
jgi:DNA repair protein RadC